jgi:nitrate reductase (NAD(P)H)
MMSTSTPYLSNNEETSQEIVCLKSPADTVLFPLPSQTDNPTEILECDKNTPDAHVPRDSRLIRLTGIHPFNCESPLSTLYHSGFLTPTELWFVRTHGAVPEVLDSDVLSWTFQIEGMVENPMTLTFAELLTFNQVTIPITMVCAGNRRKEQNVVRKGNGFNWGSAGLSTALFTGVLINEVLKLAKPKSGARYMCMEGADKLPNGYYGTSIRLSVAMNPAMGVMLAHKMNGESLAPDHGRPLRVVIPGQIGGRSVKWLKRIIISDKPSDNWYHIYDNRVLPTMATPEIVAEDKSWYDDERYALYNLNVQSVICCPAHDEVIKVERDNSYTIRGYAYSGGGVRIGRVEISLDQGRTWKLAKINYPEDLYREATNYPQLFDGKLDMVDREHSFCWCFWDIEIPIIDLSQAKDIVVRAMDESMNIQPRDMYWNILSMLNNCWHRLTITKQQDINALQFNHPTIPALTKGGWMEKVKAEGGELTDGFWGSGMAPTVRLEENSLPDIKMINDSVTRVITEEELSKHNKDGDAWFAVNGHVYDASEYLLDHPGGGNSIVLASGTDASDDFMAIHSDTAKTMLIKYHIGVLETNSNKKNSTIDETSTHTQRDFFIRQKQWTPATLKTKTTVKHDTIRLTFLLEHSNQKLGVPAGKYLYVRCTSSSGQKVIRSYTPVSHPDTLGEFDLIVKLYKACGDQPAGKMSACIDLLKESDTIDCKGPFGDFEYQGDGIFSIKDVTRKVKKLTMIADGSGITGIFQIFQRAYKDGVECDVIYCNKTEEDILLRKELDDLTRVRHCLSHAINGWIGFRGYVSQPLVGHAHDGLLLCCGPSAMVDAVYKIAKITGWNLDNQFIRF